MSALLQTPSARLAASRERLRLSLTAAPAAPSPGAGWLDDLQAHPAAGIVIEGARLWWSGHPLHSAAKVITGAATAVVTPLAQRHPWSLVASALVLGGTLAWSRPWRWALKPVLFAGLVPQLLLAALKASSTASDRPHGR